MPKQSKVNACLALALAILLYLFFQVSKHQPALAQVNAFADDPYDAIGSFGVQFVAFTALLSFIRAFRPYQSVQASDAQKALFVRGAYITCISVGVVLGADVIAMIRHPAVWIGFPAGYLLATLVGGMALLTALAVWLIHHSTHNTYAPSARGAWIRAGGITAVSTLILAVYPESWRQSGPGEILTVLVGAALLFVPIRAIGVAISPSPTAFFEDFIDDLTAVYYWLKAHAGPFGILTLLPEKILSWPFAHAVLRWLNPRRHAWNSAILIGVVMGIALTLGETFGEGGGPHQIGRFAIVAGVFIGLECAAVLLGYALLARPLGLFRRDF
jgi:hypothetical protein